VLLTCGWLRWFRDRTVVDALVRDHGILRATAYRYLVEGIAWNRFAVVGVSPARLTGRQVVVVGHDPVLVLTANNGMDDSGSCGCGALVASDGQTASAVPLRPGFAQTACGYLGISDGWTQLRSAYTLKQHTSAPGNVGEAARLKVDGVDQQHATLAAAQGSLTVGYPAVSSAYAGGRHAYLLSLKPPPITAEQHLYDVSVMVLAASEEKTYRGVFIASPTMPWA
jgi:glucoamylase